MNTAGIYRKGIIKGIVKESIALSPNSRTIYLVRLENDIKDYLIESNQNIIAGNKISASIWDEIRFINGFATRCANLRISKNI